MVMPIATGGSRPGPVAARRRGTDAGGVAVVTVARAVAAGYRLPSGVTDAVVEEAVFAHARRAVARADGSPDGGDPDLLARLLDDVHDACGSGRRRSGPCAGPAAGPRSADSTHRVDASALASAAWSAATLEADLVAEAWLGPPAPRPVAFAEDGHQVTCVVVPAAGGSRLEGTVDVVSGTPVWSVVMEELGRPRRRVVVTAGRFCVERVEPGVVRLRIPLRRSGTEVVTDWFRV